MLRLWPDRLHIALCPQRVVVMRVARGLRSGVVAKQVVCCPMNGRHPWEGALTALEHSLQDPVWNAGSVAIVLSNHFVRYTLVPWNERVTGAQEELAFAQHSFSKVHGEAAQPWVIRLAKQGFEAPRLASAVDPELLEGLRTAMAAAKLRLHSIEPYLMTAFNSVCRQVRERDCWLAVGEPGKLCVAFIQHGVWRTIRAYNTAGDPLAELQLLLERERCLMDIVSVAANGSETVENVAYIHAPEFAHCAPRSNEHWKFLQWQAKPKRGLAAADDPAFAMACPA